MQASDIGFDLEQCLIGGVEVIVTFQAGALAGYGLAIVDSEKDNSINWNNQTKQFKLKQNENENALKVPGGINFAVGDMFILTGLKMPQEYITNAEDKLLGEATKYQDSICEKRVQLSCECDPIFFKVHNIYIACGQMVKITSDPLKIDREIRCTSVKRYIEEGSIPYRYEITVSDFLRGDGLRSLVKEVGNIPDEIQKAIRPGIEYTKRTWRDVMETLGMMFDPEGDYFTGLIKPLAVHTAQLIVGTNSQQMGFIGVKFIPNADGNPNLFRSTAGKLEHFTVNNDGTVRKNIPLAKGMPGGASGE